MKMDDEALVLDLLRARRADVQADIDGVTRCHDVPAIAADLADWRSQLAELDAAIARRTMKIAPLKPKLYRVIGSAYYAVGFDELITAADEARARAKMEVWIERESLWRVPVEFTLNEVCIESSEEEEKADSE